MALDPRESSRPGPTPSHRRPAATSLTCASIEWRAGSSPICCAISRWDRAVQFHGPHGLFLLRAPLTDSIFIATGTGIAPMRGFVEHLFPDNGEDRSQGRKIWLVYGTRYESELYYEDYFERVAASRPNFFYLQDAEPADDGWEGERGYVQELVQRIAEEHARESALDPRPIGGVHL